jgi:hypothetical protein
MFPRRFSDIWSAPETPPNTEDLSRADPRLISESTFCYVVVSQHDAFLGTVRIPTVRQLGPWKFTAHWWSLRAAG